MQRTRPDNTRRRGLGHAFAISKVHFALYPSSLYCKIEDIRNSCHLRPYFRAAPHSSFSFAASVEADRKRDKFLQKRLRGGRVSISRARTRRASRDEDVEILDCLGFSTTDENGPAAYVPWLRLCAIHGLCLSGMLIHHQIIRDGFDSIRVLQNLLVQMYNDCKLMNDASRLFGLIPFRDVFSWNFMIRSCSQNAGFTETTQIFGRMLDEGALPNKFCYTSVLLAYSSHDELAQGKYLLARLINVSFEVDALLENALLGLCCKCGDLDLARQLFDRLYEWDAVSWNTMIAAHTKQGRGGEAVFYFKHMQQCGILPNEPTFVSILDACTDGCVMFEGRCLHASFAGTDLERGLVVGTALVNLYGKQGVLCCARRVFDQLQERSTVSWNGMITAYILHSQGKEALALFHQMFQQGIMPDKFVLVSMFSAHSTKEDLANGKRMLSCLFGMDFNADAVLLSAVLTMFCKCGSMKDAEEIFDSRTNSDVVMWTSMIAGYAQHGQGSKALQLFKCMHLEGPTPSQATYIVVLSACSREGLVEEGVRYLLSMNKDHGIKPSADHYNCVVDLLARCGRLDEAEDLIASISVEANGVSWTSLLDACRKHSDLERGRRAANRVFELDPMSSASLILLSNLSATC